MGHLELFTSTVQPAPTPPRTARMRAWVACLVAVLVLFEAQTACMRQSLFTSSAHESHTQRENEIRVLDKFNWEELRASREFKWVPCYSGLECAKFEVPLDYTVPDGPKANIAVAKWPSKYPTDDPLYRGPIFSNPGGPGGSGVDFIQGAGPLFAAVFGDEYDHISFDPRGVGRSTPSPIIFQREAERRAWQARDVQTMNASADGLGRVLARAEILGQLARARVGDSAPHVGTADVARDIVAMNAALGRDKIQYWGGSYGTVLGATLAAMYPNKIERMVLDSVMEPESYYRATWDKNLLATDAALDYFFTSCATSPSCAFRAGSSTARELRARFNAIMASLQRKPLAVVQGDLYGLVDWPLVRMLVFGYLYRPYATFPLLARALAGLERGDGAFAFALDGNDDSTWTCGCVPAPPRLDAAEVSAAISCGDGDPVRDSLEELDAWVQRQRSLSSFADMNSGRLMCAGWQIRAKNRFEGPIAANTSHPIFLVGNTADPVTPLASHAYAVRTRPRNVSPGSVVMAVEGPGHGALVVPSLCAMKHLRAYMRDGVLPPVGITCQADRPIFPIPGLKPTLSPENQQLLDSTERLRSAVRLPRLI